ncbi:Spy/CpxP family protein refolding chaperone [Thalassotalea piscium]
MKPIISSIVTVVVFTLSVSSMSFSNAANAHDGLNEKGHHMAKKDHRQFKRMAKYLELTDEQKQEFKTLKEQAKEARNSLKDNMKSYKAQVKVLMEADVFDEVAFKQLHTSYQDTFAEAAMLRAKNKHQMMQLLTPEQKEKAKKMKEKRGKKGKSKRS